MDSACYYSQNILCASCASLGFPLHCSQHFGTGKSRKPTSNHNLIKQFCKVGIIKIDYRYRGEDHGAYTSMPTFKSFTEFPTLPCEGKGGLTKTKVCALKSPKGFGPVPKKKKKAEERGEAAAIEEEEEEDNVVPEIVTDRMIKRIGLTVGVPLAIGILFFPLFYYLKVVLKWDVPDWLPFITSFVTFGSSALGITYGIMSTSWDPLREGSFLGWTEAQKNWPVFWQSIQGKQGKK